MQLLNHWPSENDISLPVEVKQALLTHLLEPFGDEKSAKVFWHDYPSMIVILIKVILLAYINVLAMNCNTSSVLLKPILSIQIR